MPQTIADFGLWYWHIDNADNSNYGVHYLKLNVAPNGEWAVTSEVQYGPALIQDWAVYSIPTTGNIIADNTPIETGSGAINKSGLWFNSATTGIGNNYWVRFKGNVFVAGAELFGFDAANPANLTNRSAASANMPFNSGWLSLSAERTVQIRVLGSGGFGGGFGTAYGPFNAYQGVWTGTATMEIAADPGGSNIVQSTNFGLYLNSSYSYTPSIQF
jgi:hypothetical protein